MSLPFTAATARLSGLDEAIFSAVSENLLTNAGRYAEKEICTALSLRRDRLILKVEDDGEGFSEELLRKGMQPFVRGDKSDPGHFGMGLYICRLLCEKHGGSLHLDQRCVGSRRHSRTENLKILIKS